MCNWSILETGEETNQSKNPTRIIIFYSGSEEKRFISNSESCTADAEIEQVEEEKFQANNSDESAEGMLLI